MKAIVQHAYGSSDVLRLHDIDKPQRGGAYETGRVGR
jgi:hypothetical protein